MYENLKNNSILKILLVLVIGIFIFDVFFSSITGAVDFYSYSGLINSMVVLLIKLLIALFLIMVIALLTKWLKEIYVENIDSKILGGIFNEPIVKLMIGIIIILAGIIFLIWLINNPTVMNNNMEMGSSIIGQHNRENILANQEMVNKFYINTLVNIFSILLISIGLIYLNKQYRKGTIKRNDDENLSKKKN